jgi:DNA-binding IscR family transcriptional regulator
MGTNSQLTTAIHALCWIEFARRRGDASLTSDRVAESLNSHPVQVRRTLGLLRDAGLVRSSFGRGAGWALERDAGEISLSDVNDAIGGQRTFRLHAHHPKETCEVGFGIGAVLDGIYHSVDERVSDELSSRSIADVLDEILADHPLPSSP